MTSGFSLANCSHVLVKNVDIQLSHVELSHNKLRIANIRVKIIMITLKYNLKLMQEITKIVAFLPYFIDLPQTN